MLKVHLGSVLESEFRNENMVRYRHIIFARGEATEQFNAKIVTPQATTVMTQCMYNEPMISTYPSYIASQTPAFDIYT